jgi:hypothetical protein
MDEEFLLFVPPCGLTYESNQSLRLYYCPAERAIRDARYLGIYKDKAVIAVGRISKVVRCTIDINTKSVIALDGSGELTADEQERIVKAAAEAKGHNWNVSSGHKFYLCDSMEGTKFVKSSSNGIRGHRMFNLWSVLDGNVPESLQDIANSLRHKNWS